MASCNMKPSHMEAICFNKKDYCEELEKFYKIPKDKFELQEVDYNYKKRFQEILQIDDYAIERLVYLINKTVGDPIKVYELTDTSYKYITNHKNYLPFFIIEDVIFIEYEKMIICYITGNYE